MATWVGLLLLLGSGLALTLRSQGGYPPLFAIKHVLVGIIVVDASLIHFRLFPRYFRQIGTPELDRTYRTMRRIGMLSAFCWIAVIVLSAAGESD